MVTKRTGVSKLESGTTLTLAVMALLLGRTLPLGINKKKTTEVYSSIFLFSPHRGSTADRS